MEHFHDCARCGQTVITRHVPAVCGTCRGLEREPRGEPVRLFEPAPTQTPGQTHFAGDLPAHMQSLSAADEAEILDEIDFLSHPIVDLRADR